VVLDNNLSEHDGRGISRSSSRRLRVDFAGTLPSADLKCVTCQISKNLECMATTTQAYCNISSKFVIPHHNLNTIDEDQENLQQLPSKKRNFRNK
jgi:hypothetical protein